VCATDIGWLVVAFAVGWVLGALIGLSGAARIAALRSNSRSTSA
jgi:hypothetical protein